jgi:hypothetical protein
MCTNCVAHNYNDCQFRGWNIKCNRCDSARRPGCTFSLSPSHRSHTNALLAVVSQDAVTGKFPRVFSIISLSDPFLLSDLPLALSQYHQTVANYAGLSALALNARQQMHQAIQRIGDILFSVSDDGNQVFPDYLSNDAVEAALQVLDVVEGPEFNQADDQLAFLTGALSTQVFQDLFSRFPSGQVHPQAGSSSAMILSTPPNITAPLDPQSTDNSPPHKRARATKKADPLPFAPSIAASRNVSQGEGSSSTLPVTRSQGGSIWGWETQESSSRLSKFFLFSCLNDITDCLLLLGRSSYHCMSSFFSILVT